MQLKQFTCKGKHDSPEDKKRCPVCSRRQVMMRMKETFTGAQFTGSTPGVFVGRYGYPHIQVGFMATPEHTDNAWEYDAPRHWSAQNMNNAQVLSYRSSLVNSHFLSSVTGTSRYTELAREVAMAKKPVDLDISLSQKPTLHVDFDSVTTPMGPRAKLEHVREAENPSIPVHIEKVYGATDMKTTDAVSYLRAHGYDEHTLSRILSVGSLGAQGERKLVPTRWSITATDDMIGKQLIEEIKQMPLADLETYFGEYMGNYYLLIFMPSQWSYELYECYLPENDGDVQFTTDREEYAGRSAYAHATAGGYYSVRLGVLEKLRSMKRQASVFALRIISPEYTVPLGVWVTREASRKALMAKPLGFSCLDLVRQYIRAIVKKKFGFTIDPILLQSTLLNVKQTRLGDF